MSIWKSPVFYFGVLLLLIVASALLAPFVVPWNNYRADLEQFGEKLTGRDVAIGGDIAVKLFPWPQLEAKQVAIGNPAGFTDGDFLKADVVRVSLSLAGLFSGTLDVQSVEAEKPVVNLQRNASGDVNWMFAPKEKVTGEGLLSRVRLDQIALRGGTVSFDDLKNGHGALFGDLNADLSAQSILGPWRMKGDARWNDVPVVLTVNSGEKAEGKPLKMGFKLAPKDLSYPSASLDGEWDGDAFKGKFRVDPQEATGEKTSVQGVLKPISIVADADISPQRISLLKMRIAPADRQDNGTLIEGDVIVEIGSESKAVVDLRSPRINLDTLVGASAMQQWRDGGFLAVSNQFLRAMPDKLVTDYKMTVNVLTSGGQALNDVHVAGIIQKEAARVNEFSAELPGRSVMKFDGIMFPATDFAQAKGAFKFESLDFRGFLSWLLPNWRTTLEKQWTGTRGHMEVENGTIEWTRDGFSLSGLNYRFDGSPGQASFVSTAKPAPSFNVTVNAGNVDFDSLMPNGWSMLRDGGVSLLAGLVGQDVENALDRRVVLRSGAILLNGVSAQEVALDFATNAKGFQLNLLDVGNVNGARLKGAGSLVDQGSGPAGEINFNLDAQDPRGFLRLAGLDFGSGQWMDVLGQTKIDAKLTSSPQKNGPMLEYDIRGNSGPIVVELAGTANELAQGQNALLAASGGVRSSDSAALARLFGFDPVSAGGAGDVTFDVNGSVDKGFLFSTLVKALSAETRLEGRANVLLPYFGLTGKLQITAADGRALVEAAGVPLKQVASQPLELAATLAVKDSELSFLDVVGNIAGRRLSGVAKFDAKQQLQADFETDLLDVREALALAFMPWDNAAEDFVGYVGLPAGGLHGEVFVRPLQFDTVTTAPLSEVVVGLGFGADERRVSITSVGTEGPKAEVLLKPKGTSFDVTGSLHWPVELADIARSDTGDVLASGRMLVDGNFSGTGGSVDATFASMQGTGTYSSDNIVLNRLTLDNFATAVAGAKTSEALTAALSQLDRAPGTTLAAVQGDVKLANGEAVFSAQKPAADGVAAETLAQFDMVSRQAKMITTAALTATPDAPPVTVTYSGPPGAMAVRNGSAALAARMGYQLLSNDLAQLEKLQQEQQALALKEEAQRKEDEQRFASYQSTRAELRAQLRLRKFQTAERKERDAALKAIVDAALKSGVAKSKIELLRHARQLAVRRGVN
jgi:hypothetical protein